jgi:hypothetical protein
MEPSDPPQLVGFTVLAAVTTGDGFTVMVSGVLADDTQPATVQVAV